MSVRFLNVALLNKYAGDGYTYLILNMPQIVDVEHIKVWWLKKGMKERGLINALPTEFSKTTILLYEHSALFH